MFEILIAYQSTSIFSGNYKKAYFAFERRWTQTQSFESPSARQSLTFIQPTIPPEADQQTTNEQTGVSETIRNIFERFRRPTYTQESNNTNATNETLPSLNENGNQRQLNAFADTDVYIKHCDLRKDGASMQSLSQVEATRRSSPCSYYQFSKVLGAVQTGFSPGITMDGYEKAYPIFCFDLSNSGESFDPMVSTAARVGYYRLSTLFSDPTPTAITGIYFFEYSGTLMVDVNGKVSRSFVV